MTNKFEQLIELFIAEDEQGAKDLFHEIVVEKSRDIYEGLTDEDQVEESEEIKEYYIKSADDVLNTYPLFSDRKSNPSVDTLYKSFQEWLAKGNELTPDQIEALDQAAEEIEYDEPKEMLKKQYKVLSDIIKGSKTESVEESDFDEAELGGDAADDMIDDIEADEEGLSMEDEHEGDDDMEDRVVDLEDALDELKAEFEALMGADDAADDDAMDMDMDMGDEEEGDDDDEEMESVEEEAEEMVREYTEKVSHNPSEEASVNKASVKEPKRPASDAKAVMSSGEESGSSAPKAQDMGMTTEPNETKV